MQKINWNDYIEIQKAFRDSIALGEEKTLTEYQIQMINVHLAQIKISAIFIKDKFDQARRIYANKDS